MSYLQNGRLALIAHRGGTSEGPENTLEAFQKTFEIHESFIFELDVHKSRDGEIIVMHDDTVDRTTNGHGAIRDLKSIEIEKFDAGRGFKVPRLHEVFQKFPQTKVSIDLKNPGYEKSVIDVIKKNSAEDRVVLASFHKKALKTARRLAPEICTGYSKEEVVQMLFASQFNLGFLMPQAGNVFQIPISSSGIKIYSKKFSKLAQKHLKHIHIWTINEEDTMKQLIEEGVQGIITDHPRLLFNVARKLHKI